MAYDILEAEPTQGYEVLEPEAPQPTRAISITPDPYQQAYLKTGTLDQSGLRDTGLVEALSEGGSPVAFARNIATSPIQIAGQALEQGAAAALNIPQAIYRAATGGAPKRGVIRRDESGMEELVAEPDPLFFQAGKPAAEFPRTVLQPEGNAASRLVEGFLTPGNIAAFPFAASKPVQALFLAQTVPGAIHAAGELVSPGLEPQQRKDAATELLINSVMSYGLARGLLGRKRSPEGESYASQIPSAESVLEREVRPSVGEEASLRQPREVAEPQPTIERSAEAQVLPPVEPPKVAAEPILAGPENPLKASGEIAEQASQPIKSSPEKPSEPLAAETGVLNPLPTEIKPSVASKEFDRLVLEHAVQAKWARDPNALYETMADVKSGHGTASIKAKILKSAEMKIARRNAARELGIDPSEVETVAGRAALAEKLRQHVEAKYKEVSPETQTADFSKAIKSGKKEVPVEELQIGQTINIEGEPVKVKEIDPDTHDVIVEDGRRFGTQVLKDGTKVYAEEWSKQPANASEELFSTEETPFNLTREEPKYVEPTQETTGFGAEKLSQSDLFRIQDIVKEVDPEKSANAMERQFGGAAEAATRLQRQLDTMAKDPKSYKSFTKEQRGRLNEVINLLNQRASKPELVGMGGAVPKEFERSGSPTAMKYRLIDEERAKRGLEPLTKSETVTDQQSLDRAMAKIDQDPSFPEQLVRELNANPRPIEAWENHALLLRKIELRAEYEKSAREAAQAYEDAKAFPERRAEMEAANARTQMWSERLSELESASRKSGSERGRALRALRVMVNEDFSLASLEMQKRAERGGAPITAAERVELQKIADDYRAKAEALELHQAEREQRAAKIAVEEALSRVERESGVSPRIIVIAEKIVAGLDRRADAARARIRERGFRFNVGLDPTVLMDVAEIGASYIGHAALDFAKWSAKMIDEFPGINPHLKTIWDASNKLIDELDAPAAAKRVVKGRDATDKIASAKEKIAAKLEAGDKDIALLAQQIARAFVERGVKGREAVIDSVHGVLREIDPEITRRETMDAISGYGDFKQLSRDEISVELRGIKGEMQQIAKLEDMAEGVPPRKTGIERRTPTEEERRLIKAVNEAKVKFQVPITDPATQLRSALDTRKLQLERRTAELEEKLKNRDFTKKPRRELQLDQEAIRLQHNLEVVKRKWHEELMKERLRNRTPLQKVAGGFLEAVNTFRALKASMDLSAVLRQGGFIVFGHPVRGAKTLPAMFKALRSKEGQFAVEQEILKRPNYPLYEKSGLNLTEHGQKLSQMEEAYMSRWAEKIPLVAASQRAYTVFLNKLRADSFDAMANGLSKEGKITPEEGKIIANYINVATGRGNIGLKENALVGLNSVFFAPRLVASRFQLLLGQPLYHGLFSGQTKLAGSAKARKAVAKEYARFMIGAGAVYGLAQLIPETQPIETDPRSPDFGKIRLGNTRVDPMAGLIQGSVLMSRLATGETKTAKGKVVPIRGDKIPFGTGNSADVIARFLRTKLSPAFGTALDVVTGENVVGEPVTPKSVAAGLVVPLSFNEIYETMKEQGVPEGSALAILSIFGMGLQTYDENRKPSK